MDDTRFREFMYSLVQRFSRQGITLLTTYETPDPFSGGRLSDFALSHLADNAITLSHNRHHGVMGRSLAIIKTRASGHDPAMRQFNIGPDGIHVSDITGGDPSPVPQPSEGRARRGRVRGQ
jgi:circadian clock protein KaiC